jgi:hypothetical protein
MLCAEALDNERKEMERLKKLMEQKQRAATEQKSGPGNSMLKPIPVNYDDMSSAW